ncbi:MAG: DUF3000 domain-containing protein [Actinomycetaceae bacterium]|nr:DUF3000 domain-containing protein [Actinomycetaceae bacterium]
MFAVGSNTSEAAAPPHDFIAALLSLRDASTRADILVEEVPAPRKIAPYAAALRAYTAQTVDELPIATGRFVVLYDPNEQPGWNSQFRIIIHVRSQMDDELGTDPLLGEVIWSWTHDALDAAGANARDMNGTVTRELSESFGGLTLSRSEVEIEMRASWSPATTDLAPHLEAWLSVIARCSGINDDDYEESAASVPQSVSHV